MEKFEMRDSENCYVCSEYMGPFKNELTVVTGYSEQSVSQLLELFLDMKIPPEILQSSGICQNCFIRFNEYDEHQTMANQIQQELIGLYSHKETLDHIKIEDEEFTCYFEDGDEEIVNVVSPEIEDMKPQMVQIQKHDIRESQNIFKSPRKSNYSKVDRDEGLIVVMIDGKKHYQCDFCGMNKFPSRSRLKSHRQIHTSERNFVCQTCGASFKTLNCLKNHTRLHRNIYYHCDLCPSKFKGKHELRCHIDAIHLMRKDHVCQICGKAFSRDKTLRQHLMYHVNERNIACEVCGFKTVNRPKMNRHMKTHTGERNYECKICGKRFLYSYNVTAHVKHVHFHQKRPQTSEEKLICTVCGKKFQKIWKVKDHMASVHKIVEATEQEMS